MILLAQCLCGPARHCILATAIDDEHPTIPDPLEALRAAVAAMIASRGINPWCALCGRTAKQWRYEVRASKWATMAEAAPELYRLAEANGRAQKELIASGRAYDSKRRAMN